MTRIFEVPFTYRMKGLQRGKRNHAAVFVRETIPIEVRAISAAEAPVAYRATWIWGREEKKETELRAFEGRPMKRLIGPKWTWHGVGNPLTLDNFAHELGALTPGRTMMWDDFPLELARDTSYVTNRIALPFRNDLVFKEIVVDDREIEAARTAARLSRLVSIEGEIWVEADEPVWMVDIPYPNSNQAVRIWIGERTATGGRPSFRVDRLDEALRFARHAAELQNSRVDATNGAVEMTGDIRWSSNDAILYLHETASRTQVGFQSKHLCDMPSAFFPLFLKNREFAWGRDHTVGQAAAARENLRDMLDLMNALPPEQKNDLTVDVKDRLSLALWRLDVLEDGLEADGPELDDEALSGALAP